MTLSAIAGFLGQSGLQHPAKLYRNWTAGMAGRRSGFFRYNDFTLTPSGSAMSLAIGAGDAFLLGTETATDQGGYYTYNNASETLAWPASTSLPRVDSLILRVIDTDYGSDPAGSKATWEVVSGTPAASPSAVADSAFAPAGSFYHPGAWLRVADFTVPASSTNLAAATISHKRKYARLGGHTICLSTDKPTDARLGDTATLIDLTGPGQQVFYDGSSWVDMLSLIDTATKRLSIRKSADTARASNTTVTADPHLQIANLPANTWYILRACITYVTTTAGDMKGGIFGPNNAVFTGAHRSGPSNMTASASTVLLDSTGLGNGFVFGGVDGNQLTLIIDGTFWTGDGGTMGFQWAQNASNATACTVKANSYLRLDPVL